MYGDGLSARSARYSASDGNRAARWMRRLKQRLKAIAREDVLANALDVREKLRALVRRFADRRLARRDRARAAGGAAVRASRSLDVVELALRVVVGRSQRVGRRAAGDRHADDHARLRPQVVDDDHGAREHEQRVGRCRLRAAAAMAGARSPERRRSRSSRPRRPRTRRAPGRGRRRTR